MGETAMDLARQMLQVQVDAGKWQRANTYTLSCSCIAEVDKLRDILDAIPADAASQIVLLKAEIAGFGSELQVQAAESREARARAKKAEAQLEEIRDQTARAMEGECGHSEEVHCTCRPVLLRALEELKAERDAAKKAHREDVGERIDTRFMVRRLLDLLPGYGQKNQEAKDILKMLITDDTEIAHKEFAALKASLAAEHERAEVLESRREMAQREAIMAERNLRLVQDEMSKVQVESAARVDEIISMYQASEASLTTAWAEVAELKEDLPRVKNIEKEIARLREVITDMRNDAKTLGFDLQAAREQAEKQMEALERYCSAECRKSHVEGPCFGPMGDACEHLPTRWTIEAYRKDTP